MADKNEVEKFLADFKIKAKTFGIIYRDDRKKNVETIAILDIYPNKRTEIINNLSVTDYSEGPIKDTLNKSTDLWVFGKVFKGREIYIKITIGIQDSYTICISFHISEYPIKYKFK